MFSKVEVNGDGACELYQWLKAQAPDDDGNTDIPWNFTKFLVTPTGDVIRFGPKVTPEQLAEQLDQYL